jgi:hypothetical protein
MEGARFLKKKPHQLSLGFLKKEPMEPYTTEGASLWSRQKFEGRENSTLHPAKLIIIFFLSH